MDLDLLRGYSDPSLPNSPTLSLKDIMPPVATNYCFNSQTLAKIPTDKQSETHKLQSRLIETNEIM